MGQVKRVPPTRIQDASWWDSFHSAHPTILRIPHLKPEEQDFPAHLSPAALGGPLPVHGLGHGLFRLVNHAGPLANEALGHVAERVVGIQFAYQLGLCHGLLMTALLAVEALKAAWARAKSG